mgnify:CR=1 FL=1
MSTIKKKNAPFKSKRTKPCKSKKKSLGETLTTVNTTYARIAMLLLAVNFALTGYAVYSITQIQSASMSQGEDPTSEDARIASTE